MKEKLNVLKKLFGFIDYITREDRDETYVKKILNDIFKQPGLISNIIFNINSPHEGDPEIVGYQISLIGNMCLHMTKLQKSKYMIETGTYNLIYIMTKMNDLNFTLQAVKAIRKATQSKFSDLLDSFVKGGLIEAIVDILNQWGIQKLKEIQQTPINKRTCEEQMIRNVQINCQCVIV